MTISLKELLASNPTNSLNEQIAYHGVKSMRMLAASLVAQSYHRRHYNQYGLLGAASGPIVASAGGYQLDTDLGFVSVQLQDLKPSGMITHVISVQFVGLQINETNETYDEPYIVMGIVTLAPEFSGNDELDKLVSSKLIEVPGDDHSADYIFADTQTIWRKGQLIGGTGIKVIVFAYEEDSGDPEEVAEAINSYLREKAQQGAQAIGQAYGVGAEATAIANSPELQWFLKIISLGLAGWVADDEVGYASREIPISEIKSIAAIPPDQFPGSLKVGPNNIRYTHALAVGDNDGKYTVYFRVSAAEVPPFVIPDPQNP